MSLVSLVSARHMSLFYVPFLLAITYIRIKPFIIQEFLFVSLNSYVDNNINEFLILVSLKQNMFQYKN